ncbi:hypothetical protein HGG76_25675 [Ochrobactrum tritici]|uniref:Uncharacterized protein n=1 Tax=Brucella tritici TaxID=94626 RepID=A0A7X6FVD6_9HYPH|nr:hypothetical protein [Brucella tritici]
MAELGFHRFAGKINPFIIIMAVGTRDRNIIARAAPMMVRNNQNTIIIACLASNSNGWLPARVTVSISSIKRE